MEKITARARKWGNSFGVVLPKKIVDEENIGEGTEITITIEPKHAMTVGEVLELAKKHPIQKPKKSTQELMDEVDEELWPEEE
jgi:antitoxin component of MazEF toxin-antitoxin module